MIRNIQELKNFYEKNRQQVLIAFLIVASIFLLFYGTNSLISAKADEYESDAKQSYSRLEKAVTVSAQVRQAALVQNKLNSGLLSFIQNIGGELQIANKLINLRPIPAASGIEHVSLRMENLYYDEFINFIAKIENYDNLRVRAVSFTRRYDNPRKIDAAMEIVKS